MPLILILRNRLKYALVYREVIAILMQRHVLVDGKVRTDKTYPTGFMGMLLKFNFLAFRVFTALSCMDKWFCVIVWS